MRHVTARTTFSRQDVDIAGARITRRTIVRTNSGQSAQIAGARNTRRMIVLIVVFPRRNASSVVARNTQPLTALTAYSLPSVGIVEVRSMRQVIAHIDLGHLRFKAKACF